MASLNHYLNILYQIYFDNNSLIILSKILILLKKNNLSMIYKVQIYYLIYNLTYYKYDIYKSKVYRFDILWPTI